MTKKDFIFIADTVANGNFPLSAKLEIARELGNKLDNRYPRFDKHKFISYIEKKSKEHLLKLEDGLF